MLTSCAVKLGVVVGFLGLSSCSQQMKRVGAALDTYQSSLLFTVTPEDTQISPDRSAAFIYRFENRGKDAVRACLEEAYGHSFLGAGPRCGGGLLRLVDPPVCEEELFLESGETRTWRVELEVPDTGPGPVRFTAWIQIVHPTDCDEYG